MFRLGLLVALVFLALSACGGGGSGGEQAAQKKKAPEGTFELPNGRSLYMECCGSGSPTIVLEVGQDEPRTDMDEVQNTLSRQ
jgi:hypothetical protein